MDKIVADSVAELLKLGFAGVIILCLLFVCYRLFNLYVEIQEKRICEGRETLDAITKNTNAMVALSELVRDRKSTA